MADEIKDEVYILLYVFLPLHNFYTEHVFHFCKVRFIGVVYMK